MSRSLRSGQKPQRTRASRANLFFTFFGLDAVTRKRHEHIRAANGHPSLHLAAIVGSLSGHARADDGRYDLIDQVQDIITVGEFYAMAAGGQIIFT